MLQISGPELIANTQWHKEDFVLVTGALATPEQPQPDWPSFNQTLSTSKVYALIEYAGSSDVHALNRDRTLFVPMKALHAAWRLGRLPDHDLWSNKLDTFNFCVNKRTGNREWLLKWLPRFGLDTQYYSIPWAASAAWPPKYQLESGESLHHWGIQLAYRTATDVYVEYLRHQVMCPTVITLITEPSWSDFSTYVSQHSIYAFDAGTMPIWIGGHGQADWFKSRGFDVFEDIVDHTYQYEIDPVQRMYQAIDANKHLLADRHRAIELFYQNQTRFAANRTLLRSHTWLFDYVTSEIRRVNLPTGLTQCLVRQFVQQAGIWLLQHLATRLDDPDWTKQRIAASLGQLLLVSNRFLTSNIDQGLKLPDVGRDDCMQILLDMLTTHGSVESVIHN